MAFAALLTLAACAPEAGEAPSAPSPSVPVSLESALPAPENAPPELPAEAEKRGVYTDWSKLEPYEPPELLYRRWYEEPVHELRPLDGGYGVLVPYVGSAPPDMSWGGVYEYGLMTMDGTIVVDAAYSGVYRLSLRESGELVRLPVLKIMATAPAEDEWDWSYWDQRVGAAALDGSWSIPPEYGGVRAYSGEGFFLWDEDTVYVYHTDGQLCRSIPCAGVSFADEFMDMTALSGGVLCRLEETTLRLLDLETGESAYVEGISDIAGPGDGLFPVQAADSGLWGCVDRAGVWVIPARYEDMICPFGDGSGVAWAYENGAERFVDQEGNGYSEDPQAAAVQTPTEEGPQGTWPTEDSYTGETWYLRMLSDRPGYLIEDRQGNLLGNMTVYSGLGVVNGLFLNIDGETSGYKDREGNWVFRIRLAEAGD